ncbi:hypothetical protein EB001_22565 [bacterium]|nr:hypothetical protein [bacterium]
MPFSTIDSPKKYFDTKLYTGTGATNSVGGLSFKPDLTWIKTRNSGADWHRLIDAVRGVTKELYSNATNAESTQAQSLQTFNTDGFTLGTLAEVNANGNTFVSWNFLGANTTASNTNGTISSTVSANTTSGFSIVSYTGTGSVGTVGHGLGVAPKMIIVKNRDQGTGGWNWKVYHASLGNTQDISLNRTDAATTTTGFWNNTSPTSTVFTIGTDGVVNTNTNKFIAYCFAEIKGFSKVFSYTGNGSTDGTYIHLGFRPAWVMVKASSTTGQWAICDNRRGTANKANGEFLFAESSEALNAAVNNWDFLSNGLKARANYAAHNTSGVTYIGIAFAENPFVSSKGIPACAV